MSPMTIDQLWNCLEKEGGATHSNRLWRMRLAFPSPGCLLHVGIEPRGGHRALMLRLPESFVPRKREWPRCKGLEPFAVGLGESFLFGVVLREERFRDVFTVLAEDIAMKIAGRTDPGEQLRILVGQLVRWQRFLAAPREGLGAEAQRGLWGELSFLEGLLVKAHPSDAVRWWRGWDASPQDFQAGSVAVEVKTTLKGTDPKVRISHERQLDPSAWKGLYLLAYVLEERVDGGVPLAGRVARIRRILDADPAAGALFEDALLAAGYLDAHEDLYSSSGLVEVLSAAYRVRRGFPAVFKAGLPLGLSDVSYSLTLTALERFRCGTDVPLSVLCTGGNAAAPRKQSGR